MLGRKELKRFVTFQESQIKCVMCYNNPTVSSGPLIWLNKH